MKKFIKHIVSAVIVFAIAAPAVPVSFAAVVTKTDTSTIPGWSGGIKQSRWRCEYRHNREIQR